MQIFTNHAQMVAALGDSPRIFIPTMGALHDGHASLIRIGAQWASGHSWPNVVVSIFVNPTQFNDPADLARYPRTLDADAALCREAGATAIYAPSVEDVYPDGLADQPPALPGVAFMPGLEDGHRPGHFAGVYQVVSRLFDLVRPAAAVFGEKDWQQLAVIRRMASDLDLTRPQAGAIHGVATVRESDGLALSSRNGYLSAPQRAEALHLSHALRQLADAARLAGPALAEQRATLEAEAMRALTSAGWAPDYLTVRRRADLLAPAPTDAPGDLVVLGAARLGQTRLIDNLEF